LGAVNRNIWRKLIILFISAISTSFSLHEWAGPWTLQKRALATFSETKTQELNLKKIKQIKQINKNKKIKNKKIKK
jgi:hypothetical protein